MTLGIFNRDRQFFQDLRDNGELIRAEHFDSQFNNLAAFINNELIPTVDSTIGGAIAGITGSDNYFLRNIGDGNTEWALVDNNVIPDFALEFTKLAKTVSACTIIAADDNQIFTEVTTGNSDEVLISRALNTPIWRKIQTSNIEDRTITNRRIAVGAIGAEHIQPNVLINNLPNGRITGNNFADQAVTNAKITPNSLEVRNFGAIPIPEALRVRFQNRIKLEHIKPYSLSADKISFANYLFFNKVQFVTAGKIAPQTVTDNLLEQWGYYTAPTDLIRGTNFSIGYFPSASLAPNFQFSARELSPDVFYPSMFEPTATAAFNAKGATQNS